MRNAFFRISILLLPLIIINACKSDDDSDGYVPLDIVANTDNGEVFQNASIEITILSNDTNIPQEGEIILTSPFRGDVVLNTNGTPTKVDDDFIIYTPFGTSIGEDSFEYTVCDASGQSCATGKVFVTVLPISPVNFNINAVPYPTLSEYNFFEGNLANQEPVFGVLPYEPISTLFTDYAHKKRFVWMPYGVKANYNGDGNIFEFPTGTILIKTFYYENVLPNNTTQIIETRLLIKKEEEWIYADYIWDEEQQEATLNTTGFGFNIDMEWMQNGETKNTMYRIPSIKECFLCHKKNYKEKLPIGPKPQNLNSNYAYQDGSKNQLQKWIEMGYLESVPSNITTVVDWEDTSNPLDLRVRSYLDINCAHCHVDGGHCGAREIRLAFNESADYENFGLCVTPETSIVGLDNSSIMVAGDAENSIFYYRINTTEEELRMPMSGRALVHEEFAQILKEFINSLTYTCD